MEFKHEASGSHGVWMLAGKHGNLLIFCPNCGSLIRGESIKGYISEDGVLHGRIMCPYDRCNLIDDEVVLKDWVERRRAKRE